MQNFIYDISWIDDHGEIHQLSCESDTAMFNAVSTIEQNGYDIEVIRQWDNGWCEVIDITDPADFIDTSVEPQPMKATVAVR